MTDPIYQLSNNPEYDENIRALQDADPARATTVFNPVISKALNNTHRVKKDLEALKTSMEGDGGAANVKLADGTTVEDAIGELETGKADIDPGTGKVPPELLPPMNYDPAGTAAGLVSTHNGNGGAHGDIRTAVAAAQAAADAAKAIAEGRSRGIVYASYAALVAALNAAAKTGFKTGDNLLVLTNGVPDLWVSAALTASSAYTYTTDQTLVTALGLGEVQMGYFKVSQLEGEKVDLSGYVPNTRKVNGKPLTADISLAAGDVGARPAGSIPVDDLSGTLPVSKGGLGVNNLTAGHILTGNGTGGVVLKAPADFVKYVGLVYGVCSTAGATAAKTVSAAGFTLVTGARVAVTFTYAVPMNATLNVNNTGAKNIRWQGSNMFAGIICAGDTAELVYTGSYWYLLAVDKVAAGSIAFADASWETINAIAQAGLAANFWLKGDKKTVTLTTGEMITVRLEDFNHDTLTAGGLAKLSLIMDNCLNATRRMNPSNTNNGGWGSTEMRTWMATLLSQLPADLRNVIKPVNKLTSAGNQSSAIVTTSDKLWLPSHTEVNLPPHASYSPGGEGTAYPLFVSDASRIKNVNGSANLWWLRSPYIGYTVHFCGVSSNGTANNNDASNPYGVAAGFCI